MSTKLLCKLEQPIVRVDDLPQNHITALSQNAEVHVVGVEYVTTTLCQRTVPWYLIQAAVDGLPSEWQRNIP